MTNSPSLDFIAGLRSDAVQNATGRDWRGWFNLLDRSGAVRLPRPEVASFLQETQGLTGWWSRMVAAGYVQDREHASGPARPESCSISTSRIYNAPVAVLFKAWADEVHRSRWLPGQAILIRKAVPDQAMRITWSDRFTAVNVYFEKQPDGRSRLRLEHARLPGAARAAAQQAFWADALQELAGLLDAIWED